MQFLLVAVPGLGAHQCLVFQTACQEVDPLESTRLDSEPDLRAARGDGLSERVRKVGP